MSARALRIGNPPRVIEGGPTGDYLEYAECPKNCNSMSTHIAHRALEKGEPVPGYISRAVKLQRGGRA